MNVTISTFCKTKEQMQSNIQRFHTNVSRSPSTDPIINLRCGEIVQPSGPFTLQELRLRGHCLFLYRIFYVVFFEQIKVLQQLVQQHTLAISKANSTLALQCSVQITKAKQQISALQVSDLKSHSQA